MRKHTVTDVTGDTTFEVVVYTYEPPDQPGELPVRDDGYPLFAPPRGDASALWLRVGDGGRVPLYFDLDSAAARALARQLNQAAGEYETLTDE